MIDLIKYPVLTGKSTKLLEKNQYTFDVDIRLTKPEIKLLMQELFNVKILSINTFIPPRKKRRLGRFQGFKARFKRVIVTLAPNNVISFFPQP